MAKKVPPFPNVREFLLEAPLYAPYALDEESWKQAFPLYTRRFKIDGHCPECGRDTTFSRSDKPPFENSQSLNLDVLGAIGVLEVSIYCARNHDHKLRFYAHAQGGTLQKIGQWPSLADIALDELKEYKALLKGRDGAEFHKAIGLAAHGVGVGSFVYLRRIFERLLTKAYDENKAAQGWTDDEFYRQRVPERIAQLARFLPDFLVKNRAVYAILSKGLHELTEEECLAFFEPLKMAIIVILRQEKERRERQELEDQLAKSIGKLTGGAAGTQGQ